MINFKIKGLDCAACALELEEKIQKVEGVKSASISFMTEKLKIELEGENEAEVMEKIRKVIQKEEPDVAIEKV